MAGELEEKEPTATAVIQLSLSMCHLLLRLLGHERLQLDVVVAAVGVLLLQQRSGFLVGLPSTPPCLELLQTPCPEQGWRQIFLGRDGSVSSW
jgi:hypothetical protein